MYCSECGAKMRKDSKFCPKCGKPAKVVDKIVNEPIPVVATPVPVPAPAPKSDAGIAVVIVVFVILFALAAFYILSIEADLDSYYGTSSGDSSGTVYTGTTSYYASCSACSGYYPSYSYNGSSYSNCNYYYQQCVANGCQNIRDNCR